MTEADFLQVFSTNKTINLQLVKVTKVSWCICPAVTVQEVWSIQDRMEVHHRATYKQNNHSHPN